MFLRVKELSPEVLIQLGGEVSMAYRDVGHRLRDGVDMREGRKNMGDNGQKTHTSFD